MRGDPQFGGLAGQSFQVHGRSGEHYAVISTPSLHLNALFNLVTAGRCPEQLSQRTACWSHTGNYFASVTALIKHSAALSLDQAQQLLPAAETLIPHGLPDLTVRRDYQPSSEPVAISVKAGRIEDGLTVTLAGSTRLAPFDGWQAVALSAGRYVWVYQASADVVALLTAEFVLRLDNSDGFLNLAAVMTPALQQRVAAVEGQSAGVGRVLEASMPHGLLGQTWSGRRHNSRLRVVEGDVDDYVVSGATATHFPYSRFLQ